MPCGPPLHKCKTKPTFVMPHIGALICSTQLAKPPQGTHCSTSLSTQVLEAHTLGCNQDHKVQGRALPSSPLKQPMNCCCHNLQYLAVITVPANLWSSRQGVSLQPTPCSHCCPHQFARPWTPKPVKSAPSNTISGKSHTQVLTCNRSQYSAH